MGLADGNTKYAVVCISNASGTGCAHYRKERRETGRLQLRRNHKGRD